MYNIMQQGWAPRCEVLDRGVRQALAVRHVETTEGGTVPRHFLGRGVRQVLAALYHVESREGGAVLRDFL